MVTVVVLRSWAPEQLPRAAADLDATAVLLRELATGVAVAVGQMSWRSPAADAARGAADDLSTALRTLQEAYAMQSEAVRRAAGALVAAQDLLERAVSLAAEHGLDVLPDGSVTAPPPVMTAADAPAAQMLRLADAREAAYGARDRAAGMAREALSAAAEADRDTAAAITAGDGIGALLARVAPGAAGVLSGTLCLAAFAAATRADLLDGIADRPVPAVGTDPHQVAGWWLSLPPGAQRAVLAGSPQLLGQLDGLPAQLRHDANVAMLPVHRLALEAEVARLQERLDDNLFGGVFTDDDVALELARAKLRALEVVEQVLANPDRFLLALDPSGEHLTAAVAVGDVDAADHVGTFTPGLATTVQDTLVGYDRQLAALRQQAGDLAYNAGTGTVATVAWLGYQAPQWSDTGRPSRSVANDEAAQRGAVRLSRFWEGLDAARDQPAHLTALGHSYGSLTTGLALQEGTGVDDVVFFGSPGIGTGDVGDLGLRPGRVFVSEARWDGVADLAAFGGDPNQLDGATGLSAAESVIDGVRRQESTGHSDYLTEGSTSQYAFAAVVAGRPDLAPRDDHFGLTDALWWTPF